MKLESHSVDEKFAFSSKAKSTLAIIIIVGIVLLALGIFQVSNEGHHEGGEHATKVAGHGGNETALLVPVPGHSDGENALQKIEREKYGKFIEKNKNEHKEGFGSEHTTTKEESESEHGHGEEFHWTQRLFTNLWINNVFFTGLAIIGVFFYALQFVASAGWSAGIKRIPLAFGNWLPIAGILMLGIFLVAKHHLFHWTHEDLYDPKSPHFDSIINGKKGYLNVPFFLIRMVLYFTVWFLMYILLKREAKAEDLDGSPSHYKRSVWIAAFFIIFFAVTVSTSSWDWMMSIDTHWFSTMYGWYYFAGWWVAGLSTITLFVVYLKDKGYLSIVNENHLHDLGKFVFAFSVFYTYIWFSQFLLIYYANIPEEAIYYLERLGSGTYAPVFFINIFLSFVLPFLLFMTRDAKRQIIFLKLVCPIVIIGQLLNFWLMATPGTLRNHGGLGFMEIGVTLIFGGAFVFTVLASLTRLPLIAKNHPMLEESIHHHI